MPDVEVTDEIRKRVRAAFGGFVGNEDAVYSIQRQLAVALASTPPALRRALLLSGAPSTGKTEIARRIARCIDLPFVQVDGRAVRSRESLVEFMGDAMADANLHATHTGRRSGLVIHRYPPLLVLVDECHLIGSEVQQTLLTLLEADDRTAIIKGTTGRYVLDASQIGWVFATTKPTEIDPALRTRLTEIGLVRYTEEQIMEMLVAKYGAQFPPETVRRIARVSRLVPRIAFDIAKDVRDEVMTAVAAIDTRSGLRQIMRERGILTESGLTRTDIRYLRVLVREGKPVSAKVLLGMLHDIQPDVITDDVEPWLMQLGFVRIRERGRCLTGNGSIAVDRLKEMGVME